MEVIIKQATILSSKSTFNGKKMDIHLKDGFIYSIQKSITPSKKQTVVEGKELYCTTGLFDIGTLTGEPGFEHKETLATMASAAKKGGFTAVAPVPNTYPYTQTKADIHFLISKGKELKLDVFPLGALSIDGAGVDIAEYFDMHEAGAIGFTDGLQNIQDSGLLLRALQYVTAFNGLIVHHPGDKTLRGKGLMHEGLVSTTLGLKGVPGIAELAMLQRDLLLREYADSRLLVHAISSGESVDLLRSAKKKSSKVYVTVPYLNLIATENNLEGFDVNYKVKPVLRSEIDQKSLWKALRDDTIDAIITNHVPVDEDGKKVEFPYADNGAGGLETAFIATLDAMDNGIDVGQLVSKFNEGPRRILGLPEVIIEIGEKANLCIFEKNVSSVFAKTASLSSNNPFLGHTFNTKIRATVLGDHISF